MIINSVRDTNKIARVWGRRSCSSSRVTTSCSQLSDKPHHPTSRRASGRFMLTPPLPSNKKPQTKLFLPIYSLYRPIKRLSYKIDLLVESTFCNTIVWPANVWRALISSYVGGKEVAEIVSNGETTQNYMFYVLFKCCIKPFSCNRA